MKANQTEVLSEIETLRNEVRQNDKRYEERFSRIETDIREIKNDLRQAFRLALPG
jgi:septation ring formation regulator EzrA